MTETQLDELPWNCGKKPNLEKYEIDGWRDWSDRETTPDQQRIETVLSALDLTGKRLLHIGVGNSGLARTFHRTLAAIDGVTLEEQEYLKACSLGLKNYRVFLTNKYSPDLRGTLDNKYDFIIDNNPSSFSCCRRHFFIMMKNYYYLLRPAGMLITDSEGLRWYSSINDPLWGLRVQDWFILGALFSFEEVSFNEWVIGLRKPAS